MSTSAELDIGPLTWVKGEIDLAILGAVLAAVRFQRGDLVVQQQLGVMQQSPDQGALAIIHTADFVTSAGCKKDILGDSGFTGIDMGHDAQIAHESKIFAFHKILSLKCLSELI